MKTRTVSKMMATSIFVLTIASGTLAQAADAKPSYPSMAPLEQYLSADRDAEIALARSAAPESISKDAEILVLTSHHYETAVKGTNGFVCLVMRAWVMEIDNPEFWNPKLRAPICVNAIAAPSYVQPVLKKTELILNGQSKEQMAESIKASLDTHQIPAPAPGAMSYMLSKQGYLNDQVGHWHPHVMIFTPATDEKKWGANLDGSPVLSFPDLMGRISVFLIPVHNWSDGTPDHDGGSAGH